MSFRFLLAFGTNLGDRGHNLDEGVRLLSSACTFLRFSARIETTPLECAGVDVSGHGAYLNMVAEVSSPLEPRDLYAAISAIEDTLGHPRDRTWQPRALDVDILLCALERAGAWGYDLEHEAFELCIPLRMIPREGGTSSLRIPHVGLASRPFLQTLVVDDLELPQACLKAHSRVSGGHG